jgi:4-amino-4-deoxy-L-arabinose transferase-like glycosyltransferase
VFGGPTGPFRLLESSLGGQAGWLLGAALAGLVGLAVLTRLRRSDPRTGWLLAAGGSFLVVAVAFSAARGIFHPYYTSQLAPFTAVLVGATAGRALTGDRAGRLLAAAAIAGGVATELVVMRNEAWTPGWLTALLVIGGPVAIVALVMTRRTAATLAAALALLLAGPATWSFDTLGHATSSTFPAGGPATASFAGPGGRGGFGPPAAGFGRLGGSGGMFGGDTQSLSEALTYARGHGGGTVVVASQTGAASAIIESGANVAGIGGFSGRESEVSLDWLRQAVNDGRIRWVLAASAAGGPNDGRVGAGELMSAVQQSCRASSVSGLYDCASAL